MEGKTTMKTTALERPTTVIEVEDKTEIVCRPVYHHHKRRRDSRHWWRRMQSRIHRREVITKAIYVTMISYLAALAVVFHVYNNDGIALLWTCFVIAGLIPSWGNEKAEVA